MDFINTTFIETDDISSSPDLTNPPYVIVTERLLVRRLDEQDGEVFKQIFTDADVTRYTGGIFSVEKIKTNLESCLKANTHDPLTYLTLTISLKSSEPIGFITLNWHNSQSQFAEFGVMLLKEYHGKGYCGEMLPHLVDHCFKHYGLDLFCSYALKNNHIAQHLLKRHGFELSTNKVFTDYLPNATFWQLSRYQWMNLKRSR